MCYVPFFSFSVNATNLISTIVDANNKSTHNAVNATNLISTIVDTDGKNFQKTLSMRLISKVLKALF